MDRWLTPDLVLRRRAVAEGWSDDELARHLRGGELTRLRPGAYLSGSAPVLAAPVNSVLRHRYLVAATLAGLRRPAVVSHQSAAALLGLPLWNVALDRVHVTRNPPASSDVARHLRCHVARLRDEEIVEVDGVRVTSPARTAVDLARSLPFEPAVVALDAMLHGDLVTVEALDAQLAELGGIPGSRSAAKAVAFADRRSEGVGESRSRVLLHRLGMAPSSLQYEIVDARGGFVARSDFVWEEEGLVGEFDGLVKYGRLLKPGQNPGDAVVKEKVREDAIRDEDLGVVRWIWRDLTPGVLGPRVQRALDRRRRRAG